MDPVDIVVVHGDAMHELARIPACSVDAVVTDPPYGLEFMGRGWDGFRRDDPGTARHRGDRAGAHGQTARDVMRSRRYVQFGGGTRATTSRCTGCGKRDQFRKNHRCADNARWATEIIDPFAAPPTSVAFQEWTRRWAVELTRILKPGAWVAAFGATRMFHRLAAGLEDGGLDVRDCISWLHGQGAPKAGIIDGTGMSTQLRPCWEPIVLARKPPPDGARAAIHTHGTGGMRVDDSRTPWTDESPRGGSHHAGRWPPNTVIDDAVAELLGDAAPLFRAGKVRGAHHIDHPTIKPLPLVRWLVRLLTPRGGIVLDPFAGSGTTGVAARAEGLRATLIEMDRGHVDTINRRLSGGIESDPLGGEWEQLAIGGL